MNVNSMNQNIMNHQRTGSQDIDGDKKEETAQSAPIEVPAEEKQQEADVSTEPLAEEKQQPTDVPAEPLAEEKQQEPDGEFSSIETDVKFQQVGDTTEVVAATAQDSTAGES